MKKQLLLAVLIYFFIQPVCSGKHPRNVVLLIGDGMGLAQVYAAMVANGNELNIERCTVSGFSKTYSASNFTTDSGAGGTAIACGVKTKNGMIGMSPDSLPVPSILKLASENKLGTGIVVSCSVTHATPASFIAHQIDRNMYEEIAADYLKSNIDLFIGGGRKYFDDRNDGRNLIDELKVRNYKIARSLAEVKKIQSGKLAGLIYEDQNPPMPERGTMLPDATEAAINILHQNKKGFFLMVEGSQIDWGGHDNNASQVIKEVLDFDQTVGRVIDFAKKDKQTLVVITADHETGGMSLLNGSFGSDNLKTAFSSKGHTGVPVPVFAYGPGAEQFSGFMENTTFKAKLEKLLKLKAKK
jgi:alkaline phosphatase